MLTASLALVPAGTAPEIAAKAAGITIGAQAAAAMLAARANDGRNVTGVLWDVGTDTGEWRPVAPLRIHVSAHFADVTPMTIKSTDQFTHRGPARRHQRAVRHRVQRGQAPGRTDRLEPHRGADVPRRVRRRKPVAVHEQRPSRHRERPGLTTVQQARLFVMTSMASADALIACWNNKDHWNFWRPQTAIREAAQRRQPRRRLLTPAGCPCSRHPATPTSRPGTTATRPACGRAPGRSSGPTRCRSRSRALASPRTPPRGIPWACPARSAPTPGSRT